ncbi:hypothetical protein FRC06_003881 [Ceratobasidium sp. 370]|nr:hypothetical protein FRC06_003881 [Ceratobasidium sp. 370]
MFDAPFSAGEFGQFLDATMVFIIQARAYSASSAGLFPTLEVEDIGTPVTPPSQPSADVGLCLADGLDECQRTTSGISCAGQRARSLDGFEGPAVLPRACKAQLCYFYTTRKALARGRMHQVDTIVKRDEESNGRRGETIAKAERDIDKLYEEYNGKKERQTRENPHAERTRPTTKPHRFLACGYKTVSHLRPDRLAELAV